MLIILIVLIVIPSVSTKYNIIIPNWWVNIYPLLYYFIGCYLKEYDVKISKKWLALIIFLLVIVYGIIVYYRTLDIKYINAPYNHEWYGIMPFTLSVLVFMFLNKINFKNVSVKVQKVVAYISNLVFGAYLLSRMCDLVVYKFFNSKVAYVDRIYYAPLTVLAVFISSLLLSFIANNILNLLTKLFNLVISKFKKKKIAKA